MKVVFVDQVQRVHRINWWYVVWVLAIIAFGVFVYRPDWYILPPKI